MKWIAELVERVERGEHTGWAGRRSWNARAELEGASCYATDDVTRQRVQRAIDALTVEIKARSGSRRRAA